VIVSVLFLIGLFLCISVYLILTGLNFIGLSYLLVYIGAVKNRMVRSLRSKWAAWVIIPLYKVLLIINNFLFKTMFYKNKLSSLKFKPGARLAFAAQRKSHYSQKSFSNHSEEFIKWFVGFSDAESNFSIVVNKDKTDKILSITFRFLIELHVDDISALELIKNKLNIGNDIVVYGHSCKFTVTHPKDINKLIAIFDEYNLNTTKYLDYLDFKKAFNLYKGRDKAIKDNKTLMDQILELKKGMNKSRIHFSLPAYHNIVISGPWLLGFIEGEGSFYLARTEFEPAFSIVQSETQLPVMEKIKEFLENNLGFDKNSMFKLKCSSAITIKRGKAVKNSKPLAVVTIRNTNILMNYLIPYLENMRFITKKGKDFYDFKIICTAVYNGTYRREEIKPLILKLSYSMNNYRLSTNSDLNKVNGLPEEILDNIIKAKPTIRHIHDGRQLDVVTGKAVNIRWTNCIYEITKDSGEILWASTLKEAAEILNVNFRTVGRNLESEDLYSKGQYAEIKGHKVRRLPVFYPE
jgi:hypothetical protein